MRYRTIVADPPWDVRAGPGGGLYTLDADGRQVWASSNGASRLLSYPTLTVEALARLELPAAPDAHLYLWTINAYVEAAYRLVRAWGFAPSTLLVWAKAPMGGGLGGAWGLSTEYILFARRGSLRAHGRITGSWFDWKRPYDERGKPRHSAKPEGFYDLVEQVSPGPYLELFARRQRLNWHTWGLECFNHVELDIPHGSASNVR